MSLSRQRDLPTLYLHPGEISICEVPTRVVTVLGSCVSVTMVDRTRGVGAICHGALPQCRSKEPCRSLCVEAFKFTDCALHYMLAYFKDQGIPNSELEVKLFGGADTLASKRSNSIGTQNIKTALQIIRKEKLRVIAADVGDSFGRKIIFYSDTGEVLLKRLKNGKLPVGQNEKEYKRPHCR